MTITSQFNTAFFKSKFPALVACISLYFKLQVYLETVKKEGKKPKNIYILSSVKSVVAQHCKMNWLWFSFQKLSTMDFGRALSCCWTFFTRTVRKAPFFWEIKIDPDQSSWKWTLNSVSTYTRCVFQQLKLKEWERKEPQNRCIITLRGNGLCYPLSLCGTLDNFRFAKWMTNFRNCTDTSVLNSNCFHMKVMRS